jgi:hypothetical protein
MIADRLRPHLLPLITLSVVTLAVYGRVLGHDFLLNWDDNTYVTANSSVHGFSAVNIKAAFTSYYAGNYAPLQMLSYMLDYTLWGLWPGGFLLTNVALHAGNGLLFYTVLFKSFGDRLLAAVAAAIFLLHPVQVESVAWISQRKNLLAMLFMLLAWLAYISYRSAAGSTGRFAYAASLAAFFCSLLAKSATVFFPVALLLYDYCFFAEKRKPGQLDKIPFFIVAGAAALLAMHSQSPDVSGWSGTDFGGRRSWNGGNPWTTLCTMLPVFCRYLGMIFWPAGLSALYKPLVRTAPDLTVLLATTIIIATSWLCWRLFRRERRFGYWPLFAVLAIAPVSQIIPIITLMNDRYLYFPLLGAAALGGVGFALLQKRINRRVLTGTGLLLLLALSAVSWHRAGVWKNSRTLWKDVVSKNPQNFDAWEGLGEAYHLAAPVSLHDAEYAYGRAFALYSSGPNNLFNLASVKLAQGDGEKGLSLLQRLVRVKPDYVMAWAVLGDIYVERRLYPAAENAYRMAEKLQPEAIEVNERLFRFYTFAGDAAKAAHYAARVESLGGELPDLPR